VDRPLYDQVQHAGAVLGRVGADAESAVEEGSRLRAWLERRRDYLRRWRSAYFSMYLQRDFHARLLLERCDPQLTRRKRGALRRVIAAARSPFAFAWLACRPIRSLFGQNETLGIESVLARGILWRYLIVLRTLGRRRPGASEEDASATSPMPQKLVPRQRRWLARR
jgi:hypothetical protein